MLRSIPRSAISKSLTMTSHLKIGVFGGGVVGGGVYELVQKCNTSGRFQSVGASMEISKICVRDLSKQRDFELKNGTTLVTDYNEILNDPSINCVVELMGGITR
jgi:homoserine dehydrogenase